MTYVQFDGKSEPKDKAGVNGQINVDFLIREMYDIYRSKLNESLKLELNKRGLDLNDFQFIHNIYNPEDELTLKEIKDTLFEPKLVKIQILTLIEIFISANRYEFVKKGFDEVLKLCESAAKENCFIQSFYY